MPTDPPADVAKIRVKIGAHELEAEGPHAVISTYFDAWRQLVPTDPLFGPPIVPAAAAPPEPLDLFALDVHRKLVTLRQPPDGTVPPEDVALLILYGFQRSLGAGYVVSVIRLKAALGAAGHPDRRMAPTLVRHSHGFQHPLGVAIGIGIGIDSVHGLLSPLLANRTAHTDRASSAWHVIAAR